MKIVIFGTGKIYEDLGKYLYQDDVVALLDNDSEKCGMKKQGVTIYKPQDVASMDFDIIVLMSDFAADMREQLVKMGIEEEKIVHYKDYFAAYINEFVWHSQEEKVNNPYQKSLLIITGNLGFHGASIMAFEMAKIAKEDGYRVVIAGSGGEKDFIKGIIKCGIGVCTTEFLERFSEGNFNWADGYDNVIVNTFPMVACALKIAKKKKVLIYLHEDKKVYAGYRYWENEIKKGINNPNIKILAVSNIAKDNFIKYYPTQHTIEILKPFCREEMQEERKNKTREIMKICMAGAFTAGKAQDILLDAYEMLEEDVREKCEVIFAGRELQSQYAQMVLARIKDNKGCRFLGALHHKELMKIIEEVDLIVVPSLEETMSLVAIEGMMYGKVCVVSENTGIASYIKQGENGFFFSTGDATALSKKITWCFYHGEQLVYIGESARRTYLSNFTELVFKKKFMQYLLEM